MNNSGLSILFNLAGDRLKASARVRGWWIGDELTNRGHRVSYHITRNKADYLRLAAKISRHDVTIFQKAYSRYDPWLLRWAHLCGRQAFFDIDDAPSRLQASRATQNANRMMILSDGVFAGSSALCDLAGAFQPQTHLIPSTIHLENYPYRVKAIASSPICLGWIGNGAHYAEDLIHHLVAPLTAVAAKVPLRLRIVGSCGEKRLHSAFKDIPGLEAELIDEINWADPAEVEAAIEPFDIGLYPLKPGPFNDFKCGFKALEYMASGIPVVASDVPGNADVVANNVSGYLTTNGAEWENAIIRLVEDAELRLRMGAAGRKLIENKYNTALVAQEIETIIARTKTETK